MARKVTPAVTTAAVSIAAIDMERTLALKRDQVILDDSFIRSATCSGSAPSCKGAKLMDGKVFKGSVGHQELAAWVEGLGL